MGRDGWRKQDGARQAAGGGRSSGILLWAGTIGRQFGFISRYRGMAHPTGPRRRIWFGADAGDMALNSGKSSPTRFSAKKPPAGHSAKDRDMGSALRTVYQTTVEEAVPDEMLDLLGKLD